jgi:hypothetical protein
MGAEGCDLLTDKGIFKGNDAKEWEKMMSLGQFFHAKKW